jgi:hypothetical protein
VFVVKKWPLRGRSRFVCTDITQLVCGYCATCISCKVRNNTRLRDLPDLKARIIAAVKIIDAHMLTRLWQKLEYRIDVCPVTRGTHIEHL